MQAMTSAEFIEKAVQLCLPAPEELQRPDCSIAYGAAVCRYKKRPPFFLYDSPTILASLLATRQRRA